MSARYAIGIDFGTESGRAVLVDCADGSEVAAVRLPVRERRDRRAAPGPDDDVELEPDWALQDPADYVRTLKHAVPERSRELGSDRTRSSASGIDFTSCTMLPTTADGTPLCELPDLRRRRTRG